MDGQTDRQTELKRARLLYWAVQNICVYVYRYSSKARVFFPTVTTDAIACMNKCQKYNRAEAPSFSTEEEWMELETWLSDTVRDKATGLYYEGILSSAFWMAYRFAVISY